MKKTLIFVTLHLLCVSLWAQQQMVVYKTDGTQMRIDIDGIDCVTFEDAIEDPHASVDLGLSVLWAECNMGADVPEGYGSYFAWGEKEAKESYTEDNYTFMTDGSFMNIGKDISNTTYDAASASWGMGWRMPTIAEMEELATKCTWTWTSVNGVNGYRVTGPSGNSLFLPAAGQQRTEPIGVGSQGYYWSSTASDDYSNAAYNLNFTGYSGRWSANRSYGFPIRAVKEK